MLRHPQAKIDSFSLLGHIHSCPDGEGLDRETRKERGSQEKNQDRKKERKSKRRGGGKGRTFVLCKGRFVSKLFDILKTTKKWYHDLLFNAEFPYCGIRKSSNVLFYLQ